VGERYSVLGLAALILIGGLCPQPNIASRHHAAEELLHQRRSLSQDSTSADGEQDSETLMSK
jgi:hypothetical protein